MMTVAIRLKAELGGLICWLAMPAGPFPKTDSLINKQRARNPGMPGNGHGDLDTADQGIKSN